MIRLSLLQFRVQAVVGVVVLAAFAILLAATGPHLASLYAASGIDGCRGGGCQNLADSFIFEVTVAGYEPLYLASVAIILLAPAIIGIFWGAPLIARELETGTSALAWNQSVTRTRWLAAKLTIGALIAMTVTEGLCLVQSWWAAPIGRAAGYGAASGPLTQGRFSPQVFATHGITPLGYAAFTFALGVAAGALIRRTIPAMAVTLAIFAAVQVAMPLWIRPHLAPTHHTTISMASLGYLAGQGSPGGTFAYVATGLPGRPGTWIISSGAVNAAGRPVSTIPAACVVASVEGGYSGLPDCLASQGIREAVSYQPASRYWPFQWIETAIYLALALALTGYCFRWLNRRLS